MYIVSSVGLHLQYNPVADPDEERDTVAETLLFVFLLGFCCEFQCGRQHNYDLQTWIFPSRVPRNSLPPFVPILLLSARPSSH